MWIEPNGQVKILRDIPIDSDYTHTLYFADRETQYNYFSSKAKYTYPKITYQRVRKNYMRVEINAENLYDCNYIMFQNTSFGNKWFYAFIVKVEYVANMVSEITYVIDEMQSWLLDCELRDSFIEREHSVTDGLYENIVDEQLETGDYLNTPYIFPVDGDGVPLFNEMVVVMCATFFYDEEADTFHEWGVTDSADIVSGGCYYFWDLTTQGLVALNQFIDKLTNANQKDGIISMYVMPKFFAQTQVVPEPVTHLEAITHDVNIRLSTTHNGNYEVRNKKLLTAPFRYLHVSDFHGQYADYRFEFFNSVAGNHVFNYTMGMTPEPSLIVTPKYYMGNENNFNEFLVTKSFPQVGYSVDGFKAWLAQNWGTLLTTGASALTMGVMSAPTINLSGDRLASDGSGKIVNNFEGFSGGNTLGAIGSLGTAFGLMTTIAQHTTLPSYAQNNPTADAQWVKGMRGVAFCETHVHESYAERIDKFFDMFGYAMKTVKIPNINSRPHWNYVKTGYLNIIGSIPSDSLAIIQRIFMNGITFWKNGDEVGNYNLDNRPE